MIDSSARKEANKVRARSNHKEAITDTEEPLGTCDMIRLRPYFIRLFPRRRTIASLQDSSPASSSPRESLLEGRRERNEPL